MSDVFKILRKTVSTDGTDSFTAFQWEESPRWLFVSPHDDDAILGAGLWVQAALANGASVEVAIVTDGRMGFSSRDEANTIVERRRVEAIAAYETLGLASENLHFMGFPDGGLTREFGSRLENEKLLGLEPAFCRLFRQIMPTRILTTDQSDWHSDHRITFEEVQISLFHAASDIWSELGAALARVPALSCFPVYSPMPFTHLRVEACDTATKLKESALQKFASQEVVVAKLDDSSKFQYLKDVSQKAFTADGWPPG